MDSGISRRTFRSWSAKSTQRAGCFTRGTFAGSLSRLRCSWRLLCWRFVSCSRSRSRAISFRSGRMCSASWWPPRLSAEWYFGPFIWCSMLCSLTSEWVLLHIYVCELISIKFFKIWFWFWKPLMDLIRPDFEHWKPHKSKHQKEMRITHGFERADVAEVFSEKVSRTSKESGFTNLVRSFFSDLEFFGSKFCILIKIFIF